MKSADSPESRNYELSAEHADALRRIQLKGIGAVAVFVVLFGFFAATIRPKDAWGSAAFDAVGAGLMFLIVRTYSLRTARYRIEASRDAPPDQVVALLQPFLSPWRVRFDPDGDARRRLHKAAKALGDTHLQSQLQAMVGRRRR